MLAYDCSPKSYVSSREHGGLLSTFDFLAAWQYMKNVNLLARRVNVAFYYWYPILKPKNPGLQTLISNNKHF